MLNGNGSRFVNGVDSNGNGGRSSPNEKSTPQFHHADLILSEARANQESAQQVTPSMPEAISAAGQTGAAMQPALPLQHAPKCPQDRKKGMGLTVGLVACFTIVSIVLIVFAVGASTVVGSRRFRSNARELQGKTEELVLQTTEQTLDHLMDQTRNRILKWLSRIPRCAEKTLESVRNSVVRPENASELGRQLYSQLLHFDVVYSYMGLRDGRYKAYYRDVGYEFDATAPKRPDDVVQSTFWSFSNASRPYTLPVSKAPQGFNHTPNSILEFDIDPEGIPRLDLPVVSRGEGFQTRGRPWFNHTRHHQRPTWIPPFIWVPDSILGIDACLPLYDDSGLPKLDPSMDLRGADPAAAEESLEMVVCCDTSLDKLSATLGRQNLGQHGRAFIVEVDGASEGSLIASAAEGKLLPVTVAVGVDSQERLKAVDSSDEIVSQVAQYVVGELGGWQQARHEQHRITFDDRDLVVRVELVTGADSDWALDDDGNWSPTPFTVDGLHWALVMVVVRNEHLQSLEQSTQHVEAIIDRAARDQMMMAVILGLLGGVVSFWFADVITRSVRVFRRSMDAIQQLQIPVISQRMVHPGYNGHGGAANSDGAQTFFFQDVAQIGNMLERMGDAVTLFDKFVPKIVMDAIRDKDEEKNNKARILWTERSMCTVLHIDAKWFDGLRGDKSSQVLDQFLHAYMDVCRKAVEQYGGTMVNNSGVTAVGFWDHSSAHFWYSPDQTGEHEAVPPSKNHARSACEAALLVVKETRKVIDQYLEEDWEVHCGIHTAVSFVGNFGSQSRMKYGVAGEASDGAAHVNALGPLLCHNPAILMTESTDSEVHGCFRRRFLCRDGSNFVYELLGKCEWLEKEEKEHREKQEKEQAVRAIGAARTPEAPEEALACCWPTSQEAGESESALPRSKSVVQLMEQQRFHNLQQKYWVRLVLLASVLVWAVVIAATRREGSIVIIAFVCGAVCVALMAFGFVRMRARFREHQELSASLARTESSRRNLTTPSSGAALSRARSPASMRRAADRQQQNGPSDTSTVVREIDLASSDPAKAVDWLDRMRNPDWMSLRATILLFILFMMCIVLASTGLIQYPPYYKTMTDLQDEHDRISQNAIYTMLEELSLYTSNRLSSNLNDISVCAHDIAVEHRDLRLKAPHLSHQHLERSLYSQVVRYNVTWAYVGYTDGLFTGVERSNNPFNVSEAPLIELATTYYEQENHSNVWRYEMGQRGAVDFGSVYASTRGYNVTGRPWYQGAVDAKAVKMINPYLWKGPYDIAVGIDACAPVVDDYSEQPSGRLVAVTCCANHLSALSAIMADARAAGASFLVEGDGAGSGLLLASARDGKPQEVLRVVRPGSTGTSSTVGVSESGDVYERMAALEAEDFVIAAVSRILLGELGSWSQVGAVEQMLSFAGDTIESVLESMEGEDEGVDAEWLRKGIDVSVSKLDGTVRGLWVDERGHWGDRELRVEGVHWVVVHVLPREQVLSRGLGVNADDVRDWAILAAALVSLSLLASWVLICLVVAPLKEIEDGMAKLVSGNETYAAGDATLKVSEQSPVRDIRRMQQAFNRMETKLAVFRKFVPSAVIAKALSENDRERSQAGQAWIDRDRCTVVHSNLVGLSDLKPDNVGEVLEDLHNLLHDIIREKKGVVIDFQALAGKGGEILSFWTRKKSTGNHAELACKAMLEQRRRVRELVAEWKRRGITGSEGLRCTFGAFTGRMYFGNFGTSDKLVYGVESGKVSLARRLDRMNQMHQTDVLVSESTLKRVDPAALATLPGPPAARPSQALLAVPEASAEAAWSRRGSGGSLSDAESVSTRRPRELSEGMSEVSGATPQATSRFEWNHVGFFVQQQKIFAQPPPRASSAMQNAAWSPSKRLLNRAESLHRKPAAAAGHRRVEVYQLVQELAADWGRVTSVPDSEEQVDSDGEVWEDARLVSA